jgi:predicted phosphohydrolase
MKVTLLSDLHIEWCPMPPLPGGETLLLAGDICVATYLKKKRTDKSSRLRREWYHAFFTEASQKYKQVYYIMGNHEHYSGDFTHTEEILRTYLGQIPNIKFLQNEAVQLTEKTMIFGATLWTDMHHNDPFALIEAKNCMNDFKIVFNGNYGGKFPSPKKFTPEDTVVEHNKTLEALKKALKEHDKNFLVMTHHTPSYGSIHPKYANAYPLNYAYSSDLTGLMVANPRIKNWVHGHTHDTFNYSIEGCHIMCNPRGYTKNPNILPENRDWDINFTFEVE